MSQRTSTKHEGVYYRLNAKGERRYQISYVDSTGRRVFKTVEGGLEDARRARAQVLERMHRGERVAPSKLTVAELADEYMDTQTSHLRESTRITYQGSIDAHIKPKLGHLKVSEVREGHIAEFVAGMRGTHAAWTIHGTLTPLSRMFEFAVKRKGLLSINPVKGLTKQEKPQGFNRPIRVLSTEEIGAVLRHAPEQYRLLLETAIFTGLRVGELMRLRWVDIDWTSDQLTVTTSKTRAGERDVVLPDFLMQKLSNASLDLDGGEYVFTKANGEPIRERAIARRALARALESAEITDPVRFHDLRHTFASILIGQGEDVTYVADQMGHSTPAITLTVYAKLFDPKRRRAEARTRMQEAFAGVVA